MDKEQRLRSAYREIVETDEQGLDTRYIVRISGGDAELTCGQEHPWDNENGTGNDETWQTWSMSLDTLKKLLKAGQWCVEKSEAFEKAHPKEEKSDV